MRRGLATPKAVKKVLPKHKHFETLFEYKSDDDEYYDDGADADSLEVDLDQPLPAKRTGPFPIY